MDDDILKNELSIDKRKLLDKYNLTCSEDYIWEFRHNKYHTVKYFSHKFAKKHSVIALLFYINRLCYAKIKYFEENFYKYEPYKYIFKKGFYKCDMYDMEFLFHKPSGKFIDIRSLREIRNIEDFKQFCSELEELE
ncbi:hypothetical protein [Romboutsia sp. 13368]|uniref:hypothetical protein n=1 Tax=Romboutsia sp. 13368 TaxID=2708053 RepID=UPI0025CC0A86|nr:hypothetical protein [Romboutsia sp. 13368]